MGSARWRGLLPLSGKAEHDHRPDAGPDSPDRPRPGEAGRGADCWRLPTSWDLPTSKRCRSAAANNPSSIPPAKSNCSTRIAVTSTGCGPSFPSSSGVCRKRRWWSRRCRTMRKRIRQRPTTSTALRTAPAQARCSSTLINLKRGRSMRRNRSLITKGCPGIICKYRSRRS